jgi:ABC-type phosphate transport system substrate-binding protein
VRTRWRRVTALAALALAAVAAGPAWASDIVVVVNDRVAAQTLSAEQVRAIYLGEQRFWNGQPTYPVTYPDQLPEMRAFLRSVLGMNINEFKSLWIKRIFRTGDLPPVRVNTPEEALRAVSGHAGGIGFVDAGALEGATGVHPVFRFPG